MRAWLPDTLARTMFRVAVPLVAVAFSTVPIGIAATSVEESPERPQLTAARQALTRLTTAERASQLISTSVPGTTLGVRPARLLASLRPGGVIVFGDNYRSRAQLARFTTAVQAAVDGGVTNRPGTLVSVDQEGGVVKRIPDAAPTRSHPQLGAANRLGLTRDQGSRTARDLASVGIQLNLAPVADLDLMPRRVMRGRSFGTSAPQVASHVAAFVGGLHAGGGGAAVKHFPGFGGASVNSDDALARVTRTRSQLDADLLPFRSAVAEDVDAVMVSHGIYTAIDRRHPASTSAAAYRMLRDDLDYDGVAITDSLHALGFGAATGLSVPAGCVAAVAAGADVVLLTGPLADAIACRASLLTAVRAGTIPTVRLDEAALRVLVAKADLGLLPGVSPRASAG